MTDQVDDFSKWFSDLDSPAGKAYAISSSATANVAHTTRSLYVGATGNLTVELADMVDANTVLFVGVPTGTTLPIRVRKVLPATTANSIIGLY